MRTPSEYIAAAVRGIHARSMPDCAVELRSADGECAPATRVTAWRRGEEAVDASAPREEVRVLALASDIPWCAPGCSAALCGVGRVVTMMRRDPTGVSAYVGLSQPMREARVSSQGEDAPLLALVEDGEAPSQTGGSAFVSPNGTPVTIYFPLSAWPFAARDPAFGDRYEFVGGVRATAQEVSRWRGCWRVAAIADMLGEVAS